MEAFFDFLDQHPTNVSDINRLLVDMRRSHQPNLIDGLNRGFLQYLSSKDVLADWDIDIIVQARDLYLDWNRQHQEKLVKFLATKPDKTDGYMESLLTGVGDR